MKRHLDVATAALIVLGGCNGGANNDCNLTTDSYRCSHNTLQVCTKNMFGGPAHWGEQQACSSSLVCRAEVAGPAPLTVGCFPPNAYCDEGKTTCGIWSPPSTPLLWSCVLRTSDNTFRWEMTDCNSLVPRGFCYGTVDPPSFACYELVANCPIDPSPSAGDYCDGNVLYVCFGPELMNNQAVFNWSATDCTQLNEVCKPVPNPVTPVPMCTSP